jgi:hypothetical protein
MKPGDVICNKKDRVSKHWWDAGAEELVVLDEESTVRGCIMVRGKDGKTRCVNPRYFKVIKTREEVVAEEMMRPDTVEYRRVSREKLMERFAQTVRRVGTSWEDAAEKLKKSASLVTASVEDMKRLADLLGFNLEEETNGEE